MQTTTLNFYCVVVTFISQKVKPPSGSTRLGIRCTVHKPVKPGVYHRAGAHTAGFKRHVQGRSRQAMVLSTRPGIPHGHDFCVRGRIAAQDITVAAASEYNTIAHQHSTNRYFIALSRLYCQFQRLPHPVKVGFVNVSVMIIQYFLRPMNITWGSRYAHFAET